MESQNIDLMDFWLQSSEEDYKAMIAMYESNRYTWTLFIGHLMIEKLLKAYFVLNKKESPPYIHNLLRLAELSNLKLSDEQSLQLATITAFNINARYDDYKRSFYNKCTKEFTTIWFENLKELRTWIKKQLKK